MPRPLSGEEHRLFALHYPFTGIVVRKIDSQYSDISVEIGGEYAGTLRVRSDRLADYLMQIFANGVREVGILTTDGVEWLIEPSIFGDQCISEFGDVYDTNRF